MTKRRKKREHPKVEVPVWTLAKIGVLLVAGLFLVSRIDDEFHFIAGPFADFKPFLRISLSEVIFRLGLTAIFLASGLWYFHRQTTLSGAVCIASISLWFCLGWFIVVTSAA